MTEPPPVIRGLPFRPAMSVFFCDESGRTGSNILDEDQPVHVLAGYLLGEHKRGRLRSCLEVVRRTGAPGRELKSKKLLKTPRWAKEAARCIVELNSLFVPIVVVLEKRYYAAMRLSEALFPKELPASEPELARTPEAAQRRAEAFAKLPPTSLSTLLALRDKPSRESLKFCIDSVALALRAQGEMRLAELVENQRKRQRRVTNVLLKEMGVWMVPHPTKANRMVNAGNTPELDTFCWCLSRVNSLLERKNLPACDVIFDESECEEAFRRVVHATHLRGEYARIRRVDPGESDVIPELQAADLLAGCTRAVIEKKLPGELAPAEDAILSNFFTSDFLTDVVGTKAFVDRLKVASVQPNLRRQRKERGKAASSPPKASGKDEK